MKRYTLQENLSAWSWFAVGTSLFVGFVMSTLWCEKHPDECGAGMVQYSGILGGTWLGFLGLSLLISLFGFRYHRNWMLEAVRRALEGFQRIPGSITGALIDVAGVRIVGAVIGGTLLAVGVVVVIKGLTVNLTP